MNNTKILLVEDEIIEAMDIKQTLESYGYNVPYIAISGEEAIEKALEILPDLVLMDVILRGEMNGIEAAHEIKKLDIPIIFLTAHSDEKTIKKAINTDPYGYIIKPYEPKDLKNSIEIAIFKHQQKTDNIYQEIINYSLVGIFKTNVNGDILFANNAMAKLFNYNTVEEIMENNITKMYKNNGDRVQLINELQKNGYITDYELETLDKNGHTIYALVSATIKNNLLYGMFMDITERKKAEDALRNSQEQLKVIFDSLKDQIFFKDKNLRYVNVNHALEQYFGIEKEEIIGKTDEELFELDDVKHIQSVDAGILKGEMIKEETPPVGPSNAIFDVIKNPVYNENGDITGICGIARDITERKKTENALKLSESLYRTIFKHTGTATLIYNKDGVITMINSEMESLIGLDRKKIEGSMKWMEFVHPDHYEFIVKQHNKRIHNPDILPSKYEIKFITGNGNTIDAQITVDKIPGVNEFIASVRDVTEQIKQNKYLKWELKVNKALNKLYLPLVSQQISLTKISNTILLESLKLTKSNAGYVGEILPDNQEMVILSVKHPEALKIPENNVLKFNDDNIYNGLVGYSLKTRNGFYTNNAELHHAFNSSQGLRVKKFLSVPVLLNGKLAGQISISNSSRDYTQNDLDAILRLTHFYALALQKERNEKELKNSLKEKKILLSEIHHRVKNNMQIISSLLNLQIKYEDLDEIVEVLKESQGRVKSMAIIHEKLYQSPDFTNIDFKDYTEKLISDIFYSYGIPKNFIEADLYIEDVNLNIDTAIPIGLIINELVTNSVKYAFPNFRGKITIKLEKKQDLIELTVADNGVGIAKNIDLLNSNTLGLQLVDNLVEQLDGKWVLNLDSGTQFKITFKQV